jgi:amino acid adenylation domain-containing protein
LAGQFASVLQQITTDATRPLSAYSLVTARDQDRLPDMRVPLARPVYPAATQLFLERGECEAERTAVVQGDQSWSYGELRARALAIGSTLRSRSTQARDAVAVSGPPSFGLVASIIGTLISGRVLLTVDPALPARRKDLMLREARARDFIRIDVPANLSSDVDNAGTLTVDPQTGLLKGAIGDEGVAADFAGVDGPAYIFYTSGSTGNPKGILGTRQGIDHFVAWQRKTFDIRPTDRISQLTRLSFDAILRELFLPLTSGSTLCLPDPGSGQSTLEWLEAQRVTVLHAVPSLIEHWLAEKTAPRLRRLRLTFFSGEPLTAALIKRWRLVAPDSEIVNFYGPTETTMIKCYYRVPIDLTEGMQPVGHALPDTQALVLGAQGQLCGVGEPGEIALRTPFRTLGYINAPAEQKERFRPAPTRSDPEDLLYYTGDRGRYHLDGRLEVLGRVDRQIKIRGVRIEPGEIEAILLAHPGVQRAIVLGVSDTAPLQRMVAFIVPSGPVPSGQELRAYMLERVPEPMVPSEFVVIDAIPLNANGKTDSGALQARLESKREKVLVVAPTTDMQRLLLERFKNLLGVEEIGVEDDFFARGGHSLLAAQLVARLRRELGVEVPLALIFQTPTVAGIASYLEDSMEPDARTLLEQRRAAPEQALEVIEL